jgi:Spy/CpxP family protein refolding chaperone
MGSRRLIATAIVVVLIIGAWSVSACHRYRSPAERADWMAGKIAKELELDDQQRVKLDAIKQEFLAARAEMRTQHEAMLDKVLAQIQTDHLDQTKLLQLLDEHHALETRLAPSVLAKVAELHATLSPKQKAEAVEQVTRVRERMRQHGDNAKM